MTTSIHQQVATIIQTGETEAAIDFLTNYLEKHPNRELYDDVSLLSGRFSSWERDFLRGVVTDSKEKNVVNALLLEYAKQADEWTDNTADVTVTPANIKTSPDPLEVVESQARRPHPRPAIPANGSNDGWTKYLVYGLGIAVLLVGTYWIVQSGDKEVDPVSISDKETITIDREPSTIADTAASLPLSPTGDQEHPVFRPGEPAYFFADQDEISYNKPSLWDAIETRSWFNDSLSTTLTFNFGKYTFESSELGVVKLDGQLSDGYFYGDFSGSSAAARSGRLAFKIDDYVKERLNLFLLYPGEAKLTKFEFEAD